MSDRELIGIALLVVAFVWAAGATVWGVRAFRRALRGEVREDELPSWRQLSAVAQLAKRRGKRIPITPAGPEADSAIADFRRQRRDGK